MPSGTSTTDELERRAASASDGDRAELLRDIIEAHEGLDASDGAPLRHLFLANLGDGFDADDRERFGRFLADDIEAADFDRLEVEDPEAAVAMIETMYRFRFDEAEHAERLQTHVESLLRTALQRFEEHENFEKMFELLQIAPSHALSQPELMRLRSRAHLYEVNRGRRRRRILYAYLVVQFVLITLVFPFLFINAENGRIQAEIEEAVDVDVESSAERQYLSFRDGVYWSVITAASIGYGDVTPRTAVGRFIAGTLGVMGVISIGVIAGLILFWMTPRPLD